MGKEKSHENFCSPCSTWNSDSDSKVQETPSSKWKRLLVPGPSAGTYLTICTGAQFTALQSGWTSISPSARFPAPSESWSTAAQGCTTIPCPTQSRDTHPEPDWASISPCRRPQRTGVQLPKARPQSHRPHGAQLSSAQPSPGTPVPSQTGFQSHHGRFFFRPKKYLFDQNVSLSKIENQISP